MNVSSSKYANTVGSLLNDYALSWDSTITDAPAPAPAKIQVDLDGKTPLQQTQTQSQTITFDSKVNIVVRDYLQNRGLNDETIDTYFYTTSQYNRRLYIQEGTGYFWRSIDTGTNGKDKDCGIYPTGATRDLFNITEVAKMDPNKQNYVFICEGEIDAISILQCKIDNVSAISLGTNILKQDKANMLPHYCTFIDARDNDKAGQEKLSVDLPIVCSFVKWLKKYNVKDVNELLQLIGQESFLSVIKEVIEYCQDPIPTTDEGHLWQDILNEREKTKAIPTGFTFLDEHLDGGLTNGLYVIGAPSNSGKSMFCLQLSEQMCTQDYRVIYISLEMCKYEHYTRIGIKHRLGNSINTKDKMELSAVLQTQKWLDNFYIYDEPENCMMEDLTNIIDKFSKGKKQSVMIIDYLQILQFREPSKSQENEVYRLRDIVMTLKRLSKNMPIVVISSLNRESVKAIEKADITAFAGSGSIEYSANWGAVAQLKDSILTIKVVKNRAGEKDVKGDYEFNKQRKLEFNELHAYRLF